MDAILLNRASGGGGFDDAFMDSKVFNLGLTFSYPEKNCSGMKWMGRVHTVSGKPDSGNELWSMAQRV